MKLAMVVTFAIVSAMETVPASGNTVVVVHVQNDANVPAAVLTKAEQVAFNIYAAARVRTIWIDGLTSSLEQNAAVHLTVILLSRQAEHRMASDANVGFDVLGLSKRSAGRAYIFFHRIDELATRRGLVGGDLLGKILAHELGHLILPADSHSLNGIMRANLDLVDVVQRFSREQRDTMHAVLQNHPGIFPAPQAEPVATPPSTALARR
jgi:hypothetical protein